jgi:hypothetical protein
VEYLRKVSIAAGVLFIVATVAGALSFAFFGSMLDGPDILAATAAHPDQFAVGGVLVAIMGLAGAGIAIALYPAVRLYDPGLAIGAVAFRVIEGMLLVVSAVALLALPALGQSLAGASAVDAAGLRASGTLLKTVSDLCGTMTNLAFGLGAFLYYFAFYRSRMMPRWLSGWGLLAIGVYIAVGFVALLSRTDVSDYTAFMMPLALQEMVLAVWLIAKGLRAPVAKAGSVSAAVRTPVAAGA